MQNISTEFANLSSHQSEPPKHELTFHRFIARIQGRISNYESVKVCEYPFGSTLNGECLRKLIASHEAPVIQMFIERCLPTGLTMKQWETLGVHLLCTALYYSKFGIARILVHSFNLTKPMEDLYDPLAVWACNEGKKPLVEFLVEELRPPSDIYRSSDLCLCIMGACDQKYHGLIVFLTEKFGVGPEEVRLAGRVPFISLCNCDEVSFIYLTKFAGLTVADLRGEDDLYLRKACHYGNEGVVKFLETETGVRHQELGLTINKTGRADSMLKCLESLDRIQSRRIRSREMQKNSCGHHTPNQGSPFVPSGHKHECVPKT